MKRITIRALALWLVVVLLPALSPGHAVQAAQEVPRFATLTDAAAYLRESAERCEPVIRLYLDDLASLNGEEEPLRSILALTMQCGVTARLRFDTGLLELTLRYYPGTRIVYAAGSGDVSGLSERERATYERALQIVASARAAAQTPLSLERALHDWLCANVRYTDAPSVAAEADGTPTAYTAVGALLDGSANCQGFTDAFYLLARLAGFEVRRQSGTVDGVAHTWNTILLDGQWYLVDVTYDQTDAGAWDYRWFNVGRDMAGDHVWELREETAPVAAATDWAHFFYAAGEEGFGGMCTDLGSLAYYAFTARRDHGQQTVYAMLLNRVCTWEELSAALLEVADAMGKRCNWYVWCRQVDGNTYCRIEWTAW